MSDDDLAIFEKLYNKFRPTDIVKEYSWLFDHWPEVPISRDVSYEEREEYIKSERLNVLNAICQSKGLEGLFLLAVGVQASSALGFVASQIDLKQLDEVALLKRVLGIPVGSKDNLGILQMGELSHI